jgi:hypothetical protein
MVIHIGLPDSFRQAIRYNEKKIEKKQALCIHAGNYILDADKLSVQDKVHRFHILDRLRPDYPSRVIHAVIGFHPADKLDKSKEIGVATDYIRQIGFASQPWLLYRHTDTQAPHLHLVLSKVTNEGQILQSYTRFPQTVEILRQLEQDHQLIQSIRRERDPQKALSLAEPTSAEYGKVLTRDGITAVLAHVLPAYNYSNFTELNTLLRQHRVWADSGKPGGYISETRSLSYQMLDADGRPVGKRVGASTIGFNPGLDYLEARFQENTRKIAELTPLAARVQLENLRTPADWPKFCRDLHDAGVDAVAYVNKQGQVYDIVFIDHSRKLVASAHRLTDVEALQHLHIKQVPELQHQRELINDMRVAKERLAPPLADEHILAQNLRKVKQHRL